MKENVALPSPQLAPSALPETIAVSKPLTKRWPLLLGAGFGALCLIATCAAIGAYSTWAGSRLIAPGVAIAGIPVGGLTQEEAQQQLDKRFGRLFVTLQTEERPFKLALRELGGRPLVASTVQKARKIGRDGGAIGNFLRVYGARTAGQRFALPIEWNKAALVAKLKTVDHLYAVPARNARLQVSKDRVEIMPDRQGRELNIGETAKRLQAQYFVGKTEIIAATRIVAPQIAARDLAGDDVLLASYRTGFDGGIVGRTANIRVACAAIEGSVLMPGETFSFNAHTGKRTFRKGYRMAHIFERKPGQSESEIVDGLAGGVCQVSSTLFNAVRRANDRNQKQLKIIERNSHSLPVSYVPSGLDATVAWPYADFRFRNNFPHPVYIRTTMGRSRLSISVWGRIPR